jgi:hypothetical protein
MPTAQPHLDRHSSARRPCRFVAATLAAVLLWAAAPPSVARAPTPPPKRAVPDYDGRGDEPTSARDVLLWVPRIAVSPLYAVSEFVLRRPLVFLLTEAERKSWPQKIAEFLRFGPGDNAIIYPTLVLDFGFRANGGLVFNWRDIGERHHRLSVKAATGGARWFSAGASYGMPLRRGGSFGLDFSFITRPDYEFHGLSGAAGDPNGGRPELSSEGREATYGATHLEGGVSLGKAFLKRSDVASSTMIRWVHFQRPSRTCCGETSIAQRVAEGAYDLPPGFASGYLVLEQRLGFHFDTRPPRPEPGGGVEFSPFATLGLDLKRAGDDSLSWVEYGGAIAGHIDVAGHYRILSLQATAIFVDPLGGDVPFTELVDASADGPLVAFSPGHLLGRSLGALKLEYRWPVWLFVDGTVHLAIGNVFGKHFDNVHLGDLRMSAGVGMRAASSGDIPFTLMLALGSTRLGDRFAVDSVRFVLGTTGGF